MVVYASNILTTPFLLVIWAIDIFLFLCMLRLLLGRIPGDTAKRACAGLEGVTDAIPRATRGWLGTVNGFRMRSWVPWVLTFLATFLVRQLLAWIVLKLI